MCVFNGIRLSQAEFIRLNDIEKRLKALIPVTRIFHGFEYRDWPMIKPLKREKPDIDLGPARWGFLPDTVYRAAGIADFQTKVFSLNAQSENLFTSESGKKSMWADAARNGRCLVLSSGFVEHRHVYFRNKRTGQLRKTAETFPYWVSLKNREYFYMAGVYNHWIDNASDFQKDSFAIVTTSANSLMRQIHNSKKRMPTILTDELAYRWIFDDLSDEQITEIASFQYPADEMQAWTIDKKFKSLPDPIVPFHYPELDEEPLFTDAQDQPLS